MKIIEVLVLATLSGCNLMPFVVEEAEEGIEFEESAVRDEMAIREKNQVKV